MAKNAATLTQAVASLERQVSVLKEKRTAAEGRIGDLTAERRKFALPALGEGDERAKKKLVEIGQAVDGTNRELSDLEIAIIEAEGALERARTDLHQAIRGEKLGVAKSLAERYLAAGAEIEAATIKLSEQIKAIEVIRGKLEESLAELGARRERVAKLVHLPAAFARHEIAAAGPALALGSTYGMDPLPTALEREQGLLQVRAGSAIRRSIEEAERNDGIEPVAVTGTIQSSGGALPLGKMLEELKKI